MTDIASLRSVCISCPFCATDIVGPARSELRTTGDTSHVWHCPACAIVFETSETAPSESELRRAIEAYWPNLLVA